ncbi:hypothetical protein ACK3TF_002734 [Chlorella vulgaris]
MEEPPLTASAQLLQERFSLVVEHHKAELQRSAVEQQSALRELSALRHQGEQRTTQLQRQHDDAVAALQRRFQADVQALRERLRRDVERERLACQAGVEARARELLSALEGRKFADDSSAGLASDSPTAACQPVLEAKCPPAPASTSPAPRLRLPPKQSASSRQRPAFSLIADCASAAAPAMPQPSCQPQPQSQAGAVASSSGTRAFCAQAQLTTAAKADREMRAGTHPPLSLESSSEAEPGSYFSDTDDSNEGEGLESRRSSPVKCLAPPGLGHAAGSGSSTPRTMSHACLPASDSRPGSARQVGGTSCGSGSMRSAALRAYSPCTCRQGLGLRTASGSSGWLRGADDWSD